MHGCTSCAGLVCCERGWKTIFYLPYLHVVSTCRYLARAHGDRTGYSKKGSFPFCSARFSALLPPPMAPWMPSCQQFMLPYTSLLRLYSRVIYSWCGMAYGGVLPPTHMNISVAAVAVASTRLVLNFIDALVREIDVFTFLASRGAMYAASQTKIGHHTKTQFYFSTNSEDSNALKVVPTFFIFFIFLIR